MKKCKMLQLGHPFAHSYKLGPHNLEWTTKKRPWRMDYRKSQIKRELSHDLQKKHLDYSAFCEGCLDVSR